VKNRLRAMNSHHLASAIRILVIDDDEDDVVLTRGLLNEIEDFRATVDCERSYEGALARLATEEHDIYLVACQIGGELGIAWMREARQRGMNKPVIVMTAQGSHEVDLEAMAAGAADYLIKGSIDAIQLGRSIRYTLDRARDLSVIAESESRYRHLFERVPMPMMAHDRQTLRYIAVNDAAIAHYGYSREEFLAMTAADIRPPEEREAFISHASAGHTGLHVAGIWTHLKKDGTLIEAEIVAHDVTIAGRSCRVALCKDVTEQRKTEAHMHLLARAFESSKNGMLILDARTEGAPANYVNPALLLMTGYVAEEVLKKNCSFIFGNDTDEGGSFEIRNAIAERRAAEAVLLLRRKDGSTFWNQFTLAPVLDTTGVVTHFIVVVTDLTDQRHHEAQLAYVALHDPVTGLLRFNGAADALQPLLDAASSTEQHVAIFHIDIDRFHTVNDSVGYRGGDETLHLLAQRLRFVAGEEGRLWRGGGDEFLMAMKYRVDEIEPAKIAESILEWLKMPVELASGKLYLSGSIGVAVYPTHATQADDLVHCTDAALRRAKRSGRNAAVTFAEGGHTNEMKDRVAFRGRLRNAITENELILHYQPQVRGHDGRIICMEALVRWNTIDHGVLLPVRFVPLAEELGVIVELGRWVLREACQQARRWLDLGFTELRVAVNVSALQLQRMSFLDEVCEALDAAGVPAHMLELELTETALTENIARAAEILHALSDLGVFLTLDDFGIGYSCLSQLKRFPINKLKIDRSFVGDFAADTGNGAIARAIIAMGHELHMKVLAEGVETDSQLGYLLRNHCDEFQGYLFGRAVVADEATAQLRLGYAESELLVRTRPQRQLLLVDDEQNVLSALSRLLRRDGYIIHTATCADEGFDILGRYPIEVIVSDQRMPGMAGTAFLTRVKEMYPDTIRIILSGYADLATVTDAINCGAIYKFLTKPWNDTELASQIVEAFRQRPVLPEPDRRFRSRRQRKDDPIRVN
jgi:diguanylate cyclase (GGDEF)-like protein/PAS domain S-box-containing protein